MKFEDVDRAFELKRSIGEFKIDIENLNEATYYRIEGLRDALNGRRAILSLILSKQQMDAVKAMVIADREEQIKAAMAELEKL